MGAQLPVAMDVDKDVVVRVAAVVLTLVSQFVVVIVPAPVQSLVIMDAKGDVLLIVWATVVETVLEPAQEDVVLAALDVLFKYLALAFISDVAH